MNGIESDADVEGTSSPRAPAVAVLVTGLMVASTLVAPAGEAQVSAPRPGQRVALVTGSTSGLGHELALRLGSMGTHVIVHGRNRERGMEVVEAIESDGVGSARFYRADLASFEQVREFAEAILRDYDRLDILINNAGIARTPGGGRTLSEDGYELLFQVNHLSHYPAHAYASVSAPRERAVAPRQCLIGCPAADRLRRCDARERLQWWAGVRPE